MEELFDICDINGQPTGETVPRSIAHRDGIRHRTAHVWIARRRDGRAEVLLQKRSADKDSFPGLYDTSSAGHIPAGQEPMESALRELKEELGITAAPEELHFIGNFNVDFAKEFHGRVFRDNEYVNIYAYTGTVDEKNITVQKEEIERVDWFDLETLYNTIDRHRDKFCVPRGGLEIIKKYMDK